MGDYYEPWRARKSIAWVAGFSYIPDDPERKAEWATAKAKAERDADWHLLGTGVWKPGEAVCLMSQETIQVDSTGIVGVIRRHATERGRLDAETFSKRIAACINFCAGVDLADSGFNNLQEVLTEIERLRNGMSRDVVNGWWKPRTEDEPVVFVDKGKPQEPKVRKPRHQKPPPGVAAKRKKEPE